MKLSIIIPTFNRSQYLKKCVDSILQQRSDIVGEIIIIINGKDRTTQQVIDANFANNDLIHYFNVESMTPGEARNSAVKKSKFDFVHFIDDDTVLPENFYRTLFNFYIFKPNAVVIGGPDQPPPDANFLQYSFGLALASPFCSSHTYKRHSVGNNIISNAKETHLTLANLIVKKDILKNHHISFNKDYFRNEENDLIQEISKYTKEIYHVPDLYIFHYRRENIIHSLKGSYYSGYYRARMLQNKGLSGQFKFLFFPMILIGSQIFLLLYSLSATISAIKLYAFVAFIPSFYISFRYEAFKSLIVIWILHYFIPMFYSVGILKTYLNFRRIS